MYLVPRTCSNRLIRLEVRGTVRPRTVPPGGGPGDYYIVPKFTKFPIITVYGKEKVNSSQTLFRET